MEVKLTEEQRQINHLRELLQKAHSLLMNNSPKAVSNEWYDFKAKKEKELSEDKTKV